MRSLVSPRKAAELAMSWHSAVCARPGRQKPSCPRGPQTAGCAEASQDGRLALATKGRRAKPYSMSVVASVALFVYAVPDGTGLAIYLACHVEDVRACGRIVALSPRRVTTLRSPTFACLRREAPAVWPDMSARGLDFDEMRRFRYRLSRGSSFQVLPSRSGRARSDRVGPPELGILDSIRAGNTDLHQTLSYEGPCPAETSARHPLRTSDRRFHQTCPAPASRTPPPMRGPPAGRCAWRATAARCAWRLTPPVSRGSSSRAPSGARGAPRERRRRSGARPPKRPRIDPASTSDPPDGHRIIPGPMPEQCRSIPPNRPRLDPPPLTPDQCGIDPGSAPGPRPDQRGIRPRIDPG